MVAPITLPQMMNPAPMGGVPPTFVPTPPTAVKPAVLMVKPRLNPVGGAANSGNVDPGTNLMSPQPIGGKAPPKFGPVNDTAPPAGKKEVFSTRDFLSDLASGLQTAGKYDDPFSAFAQGFAGSVMGKKNRLATEKQAGIDAEDRAYKRQQSDAQETRAKAAETRAQQDHDRKGLVSDGRLTAAGMQEVQKATAEYAVELGLHGSTLSTQERAAALAQLEEFRRGFTNDILSGAGAPDDLAGGTPKLGQPGGPPLVPRLNPSRKPVGLGYGNVIPGNNPNARTLDPAGVAGAVGDALGAGRDFVFGAPSSANPAPQGFQPQGQPAPGAMPANKPPQAVPPINIGGTPAMGSGKTDADPMRPADGKAFRLDSPAAEAALKATVPVGGYFVYDDGSGEVIRQRMK